MKMKSHIPNGIEIGVTVQAGLRIYCADRAKMCI